MAMKTMPENNMFALEENMSEAQEAMQESMNTEHMAEKPINLVQHTHAILQQSDSTVSEPQDLWLKQ